MKILYPSRRMPAETALYVCDGCHCAIWDQPNVFPDCCVVKCILSKVRRATKAEIAAAEAKLEVSA